MTQSRNQLVLTNILTGYDLRQRDGNIYRLGLLLKELDDIDYSKDILPQVKELFNDPWIHEQVEKRIEEVI